MLPHEGYQLEDRHNSLGTSISSLQSKWWPYTISLTLISSQESHHELWSRCRLISQSHVVVVTTESLLVYHIDRDRKSPPTHPAAPCILQLPAWPRIGFSRSLLVESYIQFPPPLGPNDRPLYCHDPELTLLTLEIHYIVDAPGHEPEFVQYAMFIPISTLKTLTPPPPPPPSPPPSPLSPPPRLPIPPPAYLDPDGAARARVVSWSA